jgi:thiosulfate reductase cytochrome b subunit
MATYGQTVRRGLPRQPGGDPWPPMPEGAVDVAEPEASPVVEAANPGTAAVFAAAVAEPASAVVEPASPVAEPASAVAELVEASVTAAAGKTAAAGAAASAAGPALPVSEPAEGASQGARPIRRGLPRVPGGEPWPPAASAPVPVHPSPVPGIGAAARTQVTDEPAASAPAASAPAAPAASAPVPGIAAAARGQVADETAASSPVSDRPLRRGLPRVAGGEPWPAAGFAPAVVVPVVVAGASTGSGSEGEAATATAEATPTELLPEQAASPEAVSAALATVESSGDLSPLPFTQTVFPGPAAVEFERERLSGVRVPTPEPERIGPFTRLQWAGAVIVGGGGLLYAAAMAVLAVRWLLSLEPMQEFLVAYPGEYPLPEGAPVGIPPWLGWQHFFNVFLIVLIIRSGLQVRTDKRPNVFWSPRWNTKRKISLNLWFHQSLDILWLVNGLIFVVLLFLTGQWMKIVPTSWEVFPNALSAGLQYVSLDWPTENGWVNYNSLQQLTYFATVFVAAPLAVITGVRMSGIWPKNATGLNRAYPVEWARAIHFPVMLYFVAFIIVHVTLVFATSALRNLNHMYASQDAVNWVGFWIFAASMLIIAAAWIAARPLVLAPIARLFGKVSGR